MARRKRRNRNRTETYQIKQVQGPQIMGSEPQLGRVAVTADISQKYLGRGAIGFGPTLEVLDNKRGNNLVDTFGYELYRKMAGDSEINASLDLLVHSANSQAMRAVPQLDVDNENYELSLQLADFVNYMFSRFDFDTWRRQQCRYMLTFGNAVSEIDFTWLDKGKYKNHLVIEGLRLQEPEDFGYIVDRWGEVYGVAPKGAAAAMSFPIANYVPITTTGIATSLPGSVPIYKLSMWAWDKRGTDPRGISVLDPAYIAWWGKQRAIEEWSCWIGQFARPSLWGTPGPDAIAQCIVDPRTGRETITQPTELLLAAMQNFQSASIMALPFGSQLHLLQASGGAAPFIDSISLFNREITRAILGQHLASNEGQGQSRASTDVHSKVLRMLINSLRRFVARKINNDIIEPIIHGNYGDVGDLMPVIDLADGEGWMPTVTEVAVLMQAGYFSIEQLAKIDRLLGLPTRESVELTGPRYEASSSSDKSKEQD